MRKVRYTSQIINGIHAIVNANNQVYYIPILLRAAATAKILSAMFWSVRLVKIKRFKVGKDYGE